MPGKYRFKGNQPTRIQLMTVNGNAGLTINEREGKARIMISVDSLDHPAISIFDKQGKLVKHVTDL